MAIPGVPILSLEGRDVRRFCNGMFTNNVRDLPVGGGQRTAMCDAKGRLHGLLELYIEREDRIWVVLEGVGAEEFQERYAKYIVFDDVLVTDHSPEVALLTVQGSRSSDIVRAVGLSVPEDGIAGSGPRVLRRARGLSGGFDIVVPGSEAPTLLSQLLAAGAVAAESAELEIMRVESGRVRWPIDMPGRFLLHELGLRDAVCSFEKGCYIGQEIIHRLDVMGQIRKRLVGVRLSAAPSVVEEIEIFDRDTVVGRLTSLVESPRHGHIGLAVVRMPADQPGTGVEIGSGRIRAEVVALPFGDGAALGAAR